MVVVPDSSVAGQFGNESFPYREIFFTGVPSFSLFYERGMRMWYYKGFALAALAVLSLFGVSFAGPASPFPMTVKNPDGSVVVIRNVGNEKIHYTVTEDEELVVRDSLGFWNYADSAGKSTGVRAHRRSDREKGEREFLQRRNPKKVIDKFLKAKKLQLQKRDSLSVMPLSKPAPSGIEGMTNRSDIYVFSATSRFTSRYSPP